MVLEHGCHLEISFDAKIQIGSRNEKILAFHFETIFFLQVDPVSKNRTEIAARYLSSYLCHAFVVH